MLISGQFFGIYLLQGSFLLLLIADKLQGEANPNVVKACETIVRAHEACIVTLNTEYQVSRKISSMRPILSVGEHGAKGRDFTLFSRRYAVSAGLACAHLPSDHHANQTL